MTITIFYSECFLKLPCIWELPGEIVKSTDSWIDLRGSIPWGLQDFPRTTWLLPAQAAALCRGARARALPQALLGQRAFSLFCAPTAAHGAVCQKALHKCLLNWMAQCGTPFSVHLALSGYTHASSSTGMDPSSQGKLLGSPAEWLSLLAAH